MGAFVHQFKSWPYPDGSWVLPISEKGRFRQAGIPTALADEIMEFAEENSWLGYRSLSNFVTAGARQLLQEARQEAYQKKLLESGVPDQRFLENVALIDASKAGRSPGHATPAHNGDGHNGHGPQLLPDAVVLKQAPGHAVRP